ncbi:MAG: sugar-binding domain-containing protein [Bacteroidales bacterium]
MKPINTIPIILLFLLTSCSSTSEPVIDLSGEWQFRIDNNDVGESEQWFNQTFEESVNLPGSMVENGKGYPVTMDTKWTGGIQNPEWHINPNYEPYHDSANVRFPFWLQPEKKYTGAAWYRKTVVIPENWNGNPVFLELERPHWESVVWINGSKAGMQNSLATPHVYNISEFVKEGENSITIRIDNRTKDIDVGENSHSISDHTQSNWNGIVGKLSLSSKNKVYFDNVAVFTDVPENRVEIRATVINSLSDEATVKIPVFTQLKSAGQKSKQKTYEFTLSPGENLVNMDYQIEGGALLWDEFNPNVYQLVMKLNSESGSDEIVEDFGFRDFKVNGTRFTINERPVFLRGTLECAIFPLTGYPPTEASGWEKVYTAVQAHGLNHVRFHSWCPPKAAFEVADQMGIYLQVECSSWPNQSTQLGSGFPVDEYIWEESRHIIREYGNHPSFVMMASGNEPGGPKHREYLTEFVNYWKQNDTRRIYTSAAGWPVIDANEFHSRSEPRIQRWGEELNSIINAEPPKTSYDWRNEVSDDGIPVVSHEIGQWCVYPNFREIEKYTGVLKARNFEIFRESLNANHMGHLADSFLLASGKLQALCYKADIEAALRTPGFAGFQLLDLHDFPGQGTALVGVLDPFWEEKGYISPAEFRRFSSSTVPLARLDKQIFTEGEILKAGIEVAHFGQQPLKGINPAWNIVQGNEVLAIGTLGQTDIPVGNAISLGEVIYEFQPENLPRKLTMTVKTGDFSNAWDIWVYPANQVPETLDVRVVETLDNALLNYLKEGGKVLLSLGKGKVAPDMGGQVGVGFSSIFWNTAWTHNQKPHTLGILCNPAHPALEHFPTEYHSNWQWWDAMSHADAIQLDSFPVELNPIVRIIDDWVSNRRLALLFEAKVGDGKLLVSGTDLVNNLENRPEARQLLFSLKNYMTGENFNPNVDLVLL